MKGAYIVGELGMQCFVVVVVGGVLMVYWADISIIIMSRNYYDYLAVHR